MYLFKQKISIPRILWVIFISSVILQIIAFTLPGNDVRFQHEVNRWFPEYYQIGLGTKLSLALYFLLNSIINQWYILLLILWIITAFLLHKNNPTVFAKIVSALMYIYSIFMCLRFVNFPDTNIAGEINYFLMRIFVFHLITSNTLSTPWHFITYIVWIIGILIIPVSLI